MTNYWSHGVRKAMDDSRKAPTREIRDVYLKIAEHYAAMEKFCALPLPTAHAARAQI